MDSIEYRLEVLSTPDCSQSGYSYLPNTSCLNDAYNVVTGPDTISHMERLGIFELTDLGKKVLQDHKAKVKQRRKEMWLKNAWIPILVSLATNLVISATKELLPMAKQWMSSFF